MNIQQTLLEAQVLLKEAGINNPRLDAELLLFHILQIDKTEYFKDPKRQLNQKEITKFNNLITQRVARKPIAKIIGQKEFYSLSFYTNEHTLDPRPDTEILIDTARKHLNTEEGLTFLELGTGTGCIAITLLKYFNVSRGTSVDISKEALAIAQKNARLHKVNDRATFKHGNMFLGVHGQYDLIISNPPYIEEKVILGLEPEVKKYDPMLALDGGEDGLSFYREIANKAKMHLKDNGLIILEIGYNQQESVIDIFTEQNFKLIESVKDLGRNDRCLVFSQ